VVVIETPRRKTETLEFSNPLSELSERAAEKKFQLGQDKSGKSQEISKIRSCDNHGLGADFLKKVYRTYSLKRRTFFSDFETSKSGV